ncbi:Sec-independent protein translocase subunit TatA [Streptomyces glomeratus]|uniref:Sec-independent protein translocase protein TatA n=1 Tax=Streptomyces glomeratus TaxID=284452 RepID=A0ABP6MAC4_9ACTN|nr:Sec-independent protein translocase subunit TatA [Streptomyces glomeratus]MCF1510454.1 Sec-independent protein translocase subunit TatA [Streptomyces glomeratus]
MFGRLGAPELLVILAVVLLLFGAKRLPEMARSFGQSLRILKSETKAMRQDDAGDSHTDAQATTPAVQHAHDDRSTVLQASEADNAHQR